MKIKSKMPCGNRGKDIMSINAETGEYGMFFDTKDLNYLINGLNKLGYNRAAIAKELGVSYRTMSRWVAAGSAPRVALMAMECILYVDTALEKLLQDGE
jgi:hypothetical protein